MVAVARTVNRFGFEFDVSPIAFAKYKHASVTERDHWKIRQRLEMFPFDRGLRTNKDMPYTGIHHWCDVQASLPANIIPRNNYQRQRDLS